MTGGAVVGQLHDDVCPRVVAGAALARMEAREARLVAERDQANFFRDKLAERLTLVELAVTELAGALACDESVDPEHWRVHVRGAMTSALTACRAATKARADVQTG